MDSLKKNKIQQKTYRSDTIQEIREINSLCSWGGASWKPDSMALMSPVKFPGRVCHALYKHLQHSQAAKVKPFV